MASETGFQPALRLHSLSWLFALTTSIKQMIVPLLAIVVFGGRGDESPFATHVLIPVIIAALLARALWRQWTYRYGFGPHGLVIREGLLFRNVRQIEYSRIENIDTERGLLHRLLGLAQVRVQTSTGGRPEALISVLDQKAVQEMRERIFADSRPRPETQAISEPPLLHLPATELVRYGLIDNRGMILVAAAAGLLHQSGLFNPDGELLERWLESSQTGLAALGLAMQVALAAAAIVAALIAVRLLSVVLALVTLHDFTLTRHDGDLRVRYGLMTRIALTLRTPRIQAVHQSESLLHRLLHRVSLHVDLAGDSSGESEERNDGKMKTRWLAPVCSSGMAAELIAAALPSLDLISQPQWQPLAPGARARIFRSRALLAAIVIAIPTLWYLRESSLAVATGATLVAMLCVVSLAWLHAHLYVKHTRWALTSDAVLYRSGWLTRRLTIVPRDRVQTLSVSASPFDRRRDMASVFVDTAGGSAVTGGVNIKYLARQVAEDLAAALYETDRRLG